MYWNPLRISLRFCRSTVLSAIQDPHFCAERLDSSSISKIETKQIPCITDVHILTHIIWFLSRRRLREACRNAALSGGHVAPELGLGSASAANTIARPRSLRCYPSAISDQRRRSCRLHWILQARFYQKCMDEKDRRYKVFFLCLSVLEEVVASGSLHCVGEKLSRAFCCKFLLLCTHRREPAVSYKWTSWVWEITGWSWRPQENYQPF